MSGHDTSSSTPASTASNAGGPRSPDGRHTTDREIELFKDPRFGRVIQRDVRDNTTGKVHDQVMWSRDKDFVVVVLIAPDETGRDAIWTKREFKRGVMEYVLTSTAGGIKKDEQPRVAAARELWAEFGVTATNLEQIGKPMVEAPDKVTNTKHYFFVARGISVTSDTREEGDILKFPLTKQGVEDLLEGTGVVLQSLAIFRALRASGNAHLL